MGVRTRDDEGDNVQLWEGPACGNNKGGTELGQELRYQETVTSVGKPENYNALLRQLTFTGLWGDAGKAVIQKL